MKRRDTPGAPRPSSDEAIAATAAAWLAQRDEGLAPEDEREFARWRAADPRHEAAVVRLGRAWTMLQPLRDFRPAAQRHPDRDLLAPREARGKIVAFPARAVALAAAVAVLLAAGWWAWRPTRDPALALHYTTTAGGYQRVMLTDGSVLELNSDTAAEVRFTPAERRVRLARGEAHFTVAKNAARPFWVEAGGVAVRAVGTAFNVRLGAREVEVLVTEGKVAVARVASPAGGSRSHAAAATLVANQRTVISTVRAAAAPPVPVVERVAPAAVREALAWQGPRLVFADTPLAEAIAQFNPRNTVQIELADAELGTLPIGGSFRADNVEAFVRLLTADGEIAVAQREPARIVLRKQK